MHSNEACCRAAVILCFTGRAQSFSLRNFTVAMKDLAGSEWRNCVHETDFEFLHSLTVHRRPNPVVALAERLFPARVERQRSPRGSGLEAVVRHGPIDAVREIKMLAVNGKTHTSKTGGARPAALLLRCWPALSPFPVPSAYTQGPWLVNSSSWPQGLLALAARQSAKQPSSPQYLCRCLSRSNAAGRLDGRAIPIITPVLQSSSFTREFLYVSGTVIIADPANIVAGVEGPCDLDYPLITASNDEPGKRKDAPCQQRNQRRFHGHSQAITAFVSVYFEVTFTPIISSIN